jgi:exosortase/archaeosortase
MANLLEVHENGFRKLMIAQLGVLIYVNFILLSTRQNFFMDVTTALVFTHYLFYFVNDRIDMFERWIFKAYDKIAGNESNKEKNDVY